MNTQPEALRLADWLENEPGYDWNRNYCLAVAELRRLHEENQTLKQCLKQAQDAAVSLSKANIKALEFIERCPAIYKAPEAAQALRQALAQPEQEPVAHLWECIGRWAAMIAHDGEEANLAPPDWLIDAVKAATAPPSIEAAVLAEREACLKEIAIELDEWGWGNNASIALNNVAANIRARSEK